jgi:hypothetical protein
MYLLLYHFLCPTTLQIVSSNKADHTQDSGPSFTQVQAYSPQLPIHPGVRGVLNTTQVDGLDADSDAGPLYSQAQVDTLQLPTRPGARGVLNNTQVDGLDADRDASPSYSQAQSLQLPTRHGAGRVLNNTQVDGLDADRDASPSYPQAQSPQPPIYRAGTEAASIVAPTSLSSRQSAKRYFCLCCKKRFAHLTTLKNHIRQKHPEQVLGNVVFSNNGLFGCGYCQPPERKGKFPTFKWDKIFQHIAEIHHQLTTEDPKPEWCVDNAMKNLLLSAKYRDIGVSSPRDLSWRNTEPVREVLSILQSNHESSRSERLENVQKAYELATTFIPAQLTPLNQELPQVPGQGMPSHPSPWSDPQQMYTDGYYGFL